MKIKDSYILSKVGDDSLIISTDESFSGFVRINDTAKFIFECLQEETTKECILEKMEKEYEAARDEFVKSIDITLETLRKIGALEE